MERLLEEVSFSAGEPKAPKRLTIDGTYVDGRLRDLVRDQDLSRYIL
jgi:ATP-dependent HslUV protease ATP-binding subunit HslU